MIGLPWQTLRLSPGEDAVLQEEGCQQDTILRHEQHIGLPPLRDVGVKCIYTCVGREIALPDCPKPDKSREIKRFSMVYGGTARHLSVASCRYSILALAHFTGVWTLELEKRTFLPLVPRKHILKSMVTASPAVRWAIQHHPGDHFVR